MLAVEQTPVGGIVRQIALPDSNKSSHGRSETGHLGSEVAAKQGVFHDTHRNQGFSLDLTFRVTKKERSNSGSNTDKLFNFVTFLPIVTGYWYSVSEFAGLAYPV
jgi:hypothetical protein